MHYSHDRPFDLAYLYYERINYFKWDLTVNGILYLGGPATKVALCCIMCLGKAVLLAKIRANIMKNR